jgi:hypothetical protein
LPYIKALLTRSGLAAISGPGKGLWLALGYGDWPARKNARRVVSGGGPNFYRACEKLGSEKGSGKTGQGATVRALAAFYLLLHQEQLVDSRASIEIKELLKDSAEQYISGGLNKGTVISLWSKVGILKPWYHDSALILSSSPAPGSKSPRRTWIAVVLRSHGGGDPIGQIASEIELAIDRMLSRTSGK